VQYDLAGGRKHHHRVVHVSTISFGKTDRQEDFQFASQLADVFEPWAVERFAKLDEPFAS
jgi:hypothetical protein